MDKNLLAKNVFKNEKKFFNLFQEPKDSRYLFIAYVNCEIYNREKEIKNPPKLHFKCQYSTFTIPRLEYNKETKAPYFFHSS